MLIFACIRAVKSLSLEIELPGCMYGILLIKYVSDELTENLNQSLDSVEDEDYVNSTHPFYSLHFIFDFIGNWFTEKHF